MSIALRVENVSKEYRLGTINHGMLYKDIQSFVARKRGMYDPHGKLDQQYSRARRDSFLALDEISFDLDEGERLGIMGRNGAGKSTLLKLIARITAPTTGRIMIRGRIASLLEVGTGFHPELTGRENVFLNGAILGMRKQEVARKFDEIVEFSEISKFIDTPVKRYSSGMYVRLAFAVAAHLESEILIADEVLAVGDVAFQKKCLGKMESVSKEQGKTVLFVSHNMSSLSALCDRGLYLKNGKIEAYTGIDEAIAMYHSIKRTTSYENTAESSEPSIRRMWFEDLAGKKLVLHTNGFPYKLCMEIFSPRETDLEIKVTADDELSRPIWAFTNAMYRMKPMFFSGNRTYELEVPGLKLTSKEISLSVMLRGFQSNIEYTNVESLSLPLIDSPIDVDKIKYQHWPIFLDLSLFERDNNAVT